GAAANQIVGIIDSAADRGAHLEEILHRALRGVARRDQHLDRHAQEVVEKGFDGAPRLLTRTLVGLGDIDRAGPTELSFRRLIAVLPRLVAISIEIARHQIARGEGDEEGVFAIGMRGPLHGLARALRGYPDRRMRRLIGPRPKIDVAPIEVLAIEGEGPRLRPGLDDEIMRLMKALMREIGVDPGRVIFGADAAHEAADDAPLREIV